MSKLTKALVLVLPYFDKYLRLNVMLQEALLEEFLLKRGSPWPSFGRSCVIPGENSLLMMKYSMPL